LPISITWGTKVINVPQSYLTNLGGGIYELDLDQFRLDLKALEDDEEGMPFPDTHRHNTEVTLGGITLARTIEIINGYTVTFENLQYAVNAVGANSNIADVMNVNQVSLRTFNSAGLITVTSGSGVTEQDKDDIRDRILSDSTAFDGADITYMNKIIRNKKVLSKSGSVWSLIIYDDDDTTPILSKEIKDKDGSDITDLAAGVLAQELKSGV